MRRWRGRRRRGGVEYWGERVRRAGVSPTCAGNPADRRTEVASPGLTEAPRRHLGAFLMSDLTPDTAGRILTAPAEKRRT